MTKQYSNVNIDTDLTFKSIKSRFICGSYYRASFRASKKLVHHAYNRASMSKNRQGKSDKEVPYHSATATEYYVTLVACWKIEGQNFSYVHRSRKHWKCKYLHITGPKLTFKTYNYRHCDTSMSPKTVDYFPSGGVIATLAR